MLSKLIRFLARVCRNSGVVVWVGLGWAGPLPGLPGGLAHAATTGEVFQAQVFHVTDGDTVWVVLEGGGAPRKLRIDGIDAPEICQDGGLAARDTLRRWALHRPVEVTLRRTDDYGRGLARLRLDGEDLGARLVREGMAWSHHWRRHAGPYAVEEQAARRARLGLFAMERPELPRDFRRRHGACTPAATRATP